MGESITASMHDGSDGDAIALVQRSVRAYRAAGAPAGRVVLVDRFPCVLPALAGAGVAFLLAAVGFMSAAVVTAAVGLVISVGLLALGRAPHMQAVVGDRLVLRRWWRAADVLPPASVRRVLRVDAMKRNRTYRRSLFEIEAVNGTSAAPAVRAYRFVVTNRRAADALSDSLRAAGFTMPDATG